MLRVCRQVGAGKSSLLAALLGEMQPIGGGGGARMDGRIAYCSQVRLPPACHCDSPPSHGSAWPVDRGPTAPNTPSGSSGILASWGVPFANAVDVCLVTLVGAGAVGDGGDGGGQRPVWLRQAGQALPGAAHGMSMPS